jgi:hypothetical protein
LLFSILCGPSSAADVLSFFTNALSLEGGYVFFGIAIYLPITVLLFRILFQFCLALLEGVTIGPFLLSMLVAPSLQAILLFPVTVGMILSCIGYKTEFIPTNCHIQILGNYNRFFRELGSPFVAACVGILLIAIAAVRPGAALVGFNFVWLFGFSISPIVVMALSVKIKKNVMNVNSRERNEAA